MEFDLNSSTGAYVADGANARYVATRDPRGGWTLTVWSGPTPSSPVPPEETP